MSFGRNLCSTVLKFTTRITMGGCFLTLGGAALAYAYPEALLFQRNNLKFQNAFSLVALCDKKFKVQSSIVNETKNHGLFLTIYLSPSASKSACLKALGQLDNHIESICPTDLRDETNEIWLGVGFGPDFLESVKGCLEKAGILRYNYRARKGSLGELPSTGGDIFVHAKCDELGKLFELTQTIIHNMPQNAVAKFEDIYGWVYRNGRDMTGFIDGTENPADEEDRYKLTVNPKTGGSYAITQRWVHKHDVIRNTKDSVKEQWIGRSIADSVELKKKSTTSHVARMVGSAEFDAPSKFQIVRHSQPYGTYSGDSGLFFMAYSATPETFDYMLDRMTDQEDKRSDDLMRMTTAVSGAYWFFPNADEFKRMTK